MSLFDWLFRRGAKPDPEPVVPPPAAAAPASPGTPAPNANADPYAATDFLPITRQEIVDAAKQHGRLLGAAFPFGGQSAIPSANDPRTQIIDRAMVTSGLLSPEDIAEIHRVGEEYDKVKPTDASMAAAAGLAGAAAVNAYRDAKAREKVRKKAESDARKKEHAEAVKRRRATEIIFLGRGVSGRLHLKLSDEPQLAALGLPVLHAPADVAAALGLSLKQLRWLAFHTASRSRHTASGSRTLVIATRTPSQATDTESTTSSIMANEANARTEGPAPGKRCLVPRFIVSTARRADSRGAAAPHSPSPRGWSLRRSRRLR